MLQVAETFEISDKFRAGDTLWLVFDTSLPKQVKILTIDHTNFTITLTANLPITYKRGDKIGVKRYAGIVQNAPENERTRGSCANP